jgi:hypothetical protein
LKYSKLEQQLDVFTCIDVILKQKDIRKWKY